MRPPSFLRAHQGVQRFPDLTEKPRKRHGEPRAQPCHQPRQEKGRGRQRQALYDRDRRARGWRRPRSGRKLERLQEFGGFAAASEGANSARFGVRESPRCRPGRRESRPPTLAKLELCEIVDHQWANAGPEVEGDLPRLQGVHLAALGLPIRQGSHRRGVRDSAHGRWRADARLLRYA